MDNRKDLREVIYPSILPFWKNIIRYFYEDICHKLMRPQQLLRYIEEGSLSPLPIKPAPDTMWTRSVIRWDEWKGIARYDHSTEYQIDYRHPGNRRHILEMEHLFIPELKTLIKTHVFENHRLDIVEVTGISASKSMSHDISHIDEFPLIRCREFVEPITIEHLHKNMDHGEIRLDDMRFSDFTWAKRRIHWHNAGGSHHFAAARHQAVRLSYPIPLTGILTKYSLDNVSLLRLRKRWSMFLLPKREVFGKFYEAMAAFQCAFGQCELPRNLHNALGVDEQLSIIWLSKDDPKASAVGLALDFGGFTDFGLILDALGNSTKHTARN
ncbi:hypothetical protein B1H58_17665 [Pantoea alhagi]|uniref:Uncharacterized protein n=1 Tax=Pantoea alhagi TaxID=1891675 RepID=A0A1W6B9C6_9GAMM|nr:DUF6685 family protein [Pantoea alhagi]ARJ43692.1 hypothetical protein B1H58_17665 [Pantoea alhagi]